MAYKGGAPAAADLMGGHLAFMFEMGYAALPAIQAGRVKVLAVTSAQRVAVMPQVPTLKEAGLQGFESYNWLGMIAPASTPDAVVARLNAAVNDALRQPAIVQMIEGSGGIVAGGTPEAYGRFIEQERAQWGPVIKNANISLE
ncbi:tripartite-type tricarboxylate transporter receptor subunit TctC [Variovorax sp. TBS-050B]|nr:tripartite-type tricarboxylate transporter receptor subunit TctC [Variovorax sp. TBS-050B]